jgi:hypothetical protein
VKRFVPAAVIIVLGVLVAVSILWGVKAESKPVTIMPVSEGVQPDSEAPGTRPPASVTLADDEKQKIPDPPTNG